jgi:predicted DNA-binding transcriptional regulator YafY
MPRNDQVTRQWYLLRKLEGSRGATIQELAESLPDDYPKHLRTIRRDLDALQGVGFPLLTERVDGRVRWRLMEGFRRIPALAFSPTELMALMFSRDLLRPLEGTEIKDSLDSALNKAAAALPPQGQSYVRQLQGFFSVGLGPHKTYRQHQETIDRITRAITQLRTIQMRYYSASRNTTTRREVDPYRLWYAAGALYLIAYCHWRRDVRLFAVDRIRSLTITDHPYQMPLGFDVEAYVQDALVVMRGERVTVELLFSKSAAPWVKDRVWHPSQNLTPLRGGSLKMTLAVADTPELVGWILSFGTAVRVVRPEALRERVREEARKIASGKLA